MTARELRREFNELFERAAFGDSGARDILVGRWSTLEPAIRDLVDEYSRHYLERYRQLAGWLNTDEFRQRAAAVPRTKRVDEQSLLDAALSQKPQSEPLDEGKDRRRSAIITSRPRHVSRPPKRTAIGDQKVREGTYVSVIDAISVHERLVVDFMMSDDPINPKGIRDMNLLNSAINRQHTSLGETRKYNSVAEVAASLLFGMVLDHPFHNGNKRTGLVSMLQLLDRNGVYLDVTEEDLFEFLVAVADHRVTQATDTDGEVAGIAAWIGARLERMDKREYPMSLRDLVGRLQREGCTIGDFEGGHLSIYRQGFPRKRLSFHALNEEVKPSEIQDIRQHFHLDPGHGITSRAFYGSADPIDVWINKYRQLLRQLGKV